MRPSWCVLLVLALSACRSDYADRDILGTYQANHSMGTEVLVVLADHSYRYFFIGRDGGEVTNQGTWQFEPFDGHPGVTFNNFIFGMPQYGGGRHGFWPVEIERTLLGKIEFCIDPDMGYYFVRRS